VSPTQRATLIYLAAAATSAAVPFVVLPILARWLGPTDFGIVGNYLALVNVAVVLAGLSVHGIVSVVHFRDGGNAVPAYLRGAMRLLLLTTVPLLVVLLTLARWLEQATSIPSLWLWSILAVAAGQFVVSLGLAVFQAREQAIRYGTMQIGLAVGWGALTLALTGGAGLGWESRAIAQIVAVWLACVVAVSLLAREGLVRRSGPSVDVAVLLRFGLPLVPHSLAATLMSSADRLVLTSAGGADIAGQYFAAFQVAAVLTVGAAAVNQAWVPWLYRRLASPSRQGQREVVRLTYLANLLLLGGAAVLATTSAWLLPWIAGPAYQPAGPLLRWLAPAAAFSGMYYFVTNYLFYAGRTGLLSMITVCCAALQLALIAWLVPIWGAEGAAVSVLIGSISYWIAVWIAAQHVIPMPWLPRSGVMPT
jgi:O-antigen/teichoic acid export membrane protein